MLRLTGQERALARILLSRIKQCSWATQVFTYHGHMAEDGLSAGSPDFKEHRINNVGSKEREVGEVSCRDFTKLAKSPFLLLYMCKFILRKYNSNLDVSN